MVDFFKHFNLHSKDLPHGFETRRIDGEPNGELMTAEKVERRRAAAEVNGYDGFNIWYDHNGDSVGLEGKLWFEYASLELQFDTACTAHDGFLGNAAMLLERDYALHINVPAYRKQQQS